MCSKTELSDMENSLKEKYILILSKMSLVELKNFSKGEYKTLSLKDLKHAFPMHKNGKQLEEAAQCIAKAFDREAKLQCKNRAHESTTTNKMSSLL